MRVAGPIIRYASATVEEREIPAWQCTSTRNRPAGGDWGRPLRQSQNQPSKKSKSALNIERSKAPSASAISNLNFINPTKSATFSSLSTRAISNLLESINQCNQQPPQVYQPVCKQHPQVHQPQTYNFPKRPTPKAPSASAIGNLNFINPTKSATFSSLSTRAISNLLKSINQCNQQPPQVYQPVQSATSSLSTPNMQPSQTPDPRHAPSLLECEPRALDERRALRQARPQRRRGLGAVPHGHAAVLQRRIAQRRHLGGQRQHIPPGFAAGMHFHAQKINEKLKPIGKQWKKPTAKGSKPKNKNRKKGMID
jgi:hypothetical protein